MGSEMCIRDRKHCAARIFLCLFAAIFIPVTGMNIAANKHKNIRAAQCFNLKSTKLSRLHNDANIITLGSRLITKKNALKFVSVFLNTKFDGGRHLRRVKKI